VEISKEQVEHVAKLARLEVSEDEKAMFARQLSAILTYMDQLKEVDTEGVEPTATVLPTENVWREDAVRPRCRRSRRWPTRRTRRTGFSAYPRF